MSAEHIGQLVLQVTFFCCWGFIGVTSFYWPWWQNQVGWSITLKSAAIGLALLPAMMHEWFGADQRQPFMEWLAVAALAAIPLILIWRAVVIYRIQRHTRKR